MNAPRRLKLALVEDDPGDAYILERHLRECSGLCSTVTVYGSFAAARPFLADSDCVLLNLSLPDMRGDELVDAMLSEFPLVPVVVITGREDEEFALKVIHSGAQDYVLKGSYDSMILGNIVRFAVERHQLTTELRSVNRRLAASLAEIETLHGLLPICAGCKKIRDTDDSWQEVDVYITKHSAVTFSHGLCPACFARYRDEVTAFKPRRDEGDGQRPTDSAGG